METRSRYVLLPSLRTDGEVSPPRAETGMMAVNEFWSKLTGTKSPLGKIVVKPWETSNISRVALTPRPEGLGQKKSRTLGNPVAGFASVSKSTYPPRRCGDVTSAGSTGPAKATFRQRVE